MHEMAGAECKYLGPCLTPSEVEARVAEARRAALKEAAKRLEELHRNHGYNSATGQVMRRGEIVTNSNEIDHALGYYRAVSEGVAHILALGEEP
ncbi:MAG: hypothetical protein INF64_01010 [Roseomonas sp.]|nr:hypothetical protein [Roseomonas sp.]